MAADVHGLRRRPAAAKEVPANKAAPTAKAPRRKRSAAPGLPIGQIVDRNIAARGGLAAWRA